jgi:hypothetical protein
MEMRNVAMRLIQRLICGLTLAVALSAASPAWACPLCQSTASSAIDDGDDPLREAQAYNRSIYFMLAVPYSIIGFAGIYCYRNFGRAQGGTPNPGT